MSRLAQKIRHLFQRRARVRRLEEEMQTHIDLLTEEGVRQGLDRPEARRRAHLAFGNVLSTREETEDALGWPALESLAHDVRIAFRSLVRRPAFSFSLILILALGIGATTSIFTLVRGMLWTPLPVPAPQELRAALNNEQRQFRFSAPTVRRLEASTGLRGRVAAYTDVNRLILRRGDASAETFMAQFVNGAFFSSLQLSAAQGRLLTPADDNENHPNPVAVISWTWWQRKLGGDPAIIGQTLRLNGVDVTVVGVAAANFASVMIGDAPDAWVPLSLVATVRAQPSASIVSRKDSPGLADWVRVDNVFWLHVLLRERAGAPAAQGVLEAAWQPQLDAALAEMDDATDRTEFARDRPRLVPSPGGYSSTRKSFRTVGLTLSLLVGAVVLVTAANSSTLLLLRQLARSRELGVRLALGAGPWRLARAALMEGLVLSLGGAVAGGVLALWLTPLLAGWLVPDAVDSLPGIDPTLLLSLGGLAVALGLALGAAPAWLSAHLSPQTIIQQRGAMAGGSLRLGRILIVVQLALSVLLVAVAVSLARDLRHVLHSELGYSRQSVVTTFFDLSASGIAPERQEATARRLRAAAAALPGVQSVGFAQAGVLSGSSTSSGIYFRGEGVNQPKDSVQTESIDEGYLSTLGLGLLRGRGISMDDRANRPRVAVLSQALAKQVYGSADPIGRRFGFGPIADQDDWEIVGVVADARVNDVREAPTPLIYMSLLQWQSAPHCLAIRVAGDAAAVRETIRKQISAAEPNVMFSRWATIEERIDQWTSHDRAAVRLTAGFGALATLLAGLGVFGALGYLVASRSRDIAVRLAIGAEPGLIWRGIVKEAFILGLAGAGLGLFFAAVLPRWLSAWMMTGLHTDWLAITLAVIAGLAAAVLGGLIPARRAAKVDPLKLLRAE
ncbi:MAG: ABC transporter permease [Verrucomicrobia bacterium]|nr:ABC transporter permease [Verrucomicrobiota bacterium]